MRSGNNAGMFIIPKQRPVITDPVEARKVLAQVALKEAARKRSWFQVVPPEERTWNGIVFASLHEMRNHQSLTQQETLGLISNLRRQVKYELRIGPHLITRYVADHVYYDETLKREIVADSKGKRTEVFVVKKKLMKILLNIDVMEI